MAEKITFSKKDLKMPEEKFGIVEEHSSYLGVILGILIVFLMLILAGLYVWGEFLREQANTPAPSVSAERPSDDVNNEPESTNAEASVETIRAVSTSDEINAIDADLQSTIILESLDADITAIEAEFIQ